jgi:hypothetical protein
MVIRVKNHVVAFVAGGLLVGLLATALAYTVAGASGGPTLDMDTPEGLPVVVQRGAERSNVSNLEARAVTSDGKLGVYVGTDRSGNSMVAFGSPEFSSPFVRLQSVLSRKDLELLSVGGGSAGTNVDFADVVGIVSARVTRLEILTAGGQQRELVPQNNAFVYAAASPDDFALGVKAYGASGVLLDSKSITPPSPLDEG